MLSENKHWVLLGRQYSMVVKNYLLEWDLFWLISWVTTAKFFGLSLSFLTCNIVLILLHAEILSNDKEEVNVNYSGKCIDVVALLATKNVANNSRGKCISSRGNHYGKLSVKAKASKLSFICFSHHPLRMNFNGKFQAVTFIYSHC